MTPEHARNEREVLKSQISFQRYVIVGALGLSVVLAGGWLWTAMNSVVAIVPPEVKRPYEIGSNFGNRDYLSDMANFVLQTVLTVSPDSVDYNNKVILKMTDPDGYGKLKADLEGAALRMKRDRVSTVWTPRKEEVQERDKRVKVSGRLKTYVADTLTSDREKEYLIEFNVTAAGRLYVVSLQEVVKPDPARPAGQPAG
ncbi:MAG: type IV conjugative transfer system protein TraE [Betaproteobacteria bacterium]